MYIKNEMTIGFKIPEDCDKLQKFREETDTSVWQQKFDSTYIYYTKSDNFIIRDKERE